MDSNSLYTYWSDIWKRLRERWTVLTALYILIGIVIMAIVGPLISPHNHAEVHLDLRNLPPGKVFWFGTDELGRDLFSRCWWGARISLFVGFTVALVDLFIGVFYGAAAALFGGKIDEFLMRFADVLYTVPYFLVVILLMVVMGPGLWPIIIALSLTGWVNVSRIIRSQVLQIKQQDFVVAAYALGASRMRILWRHLIPNTTGTIIVILTLSVPTVIFSEAFLSFLGLGVQAPFASWGTLANDGLVALRYYPWRLMIPALLISVTMLSLNIVGDALRDSLDPIRIRH